MSIPRDLMVRSPAAARTARSHGAQFAQFNWAFEFGGAACTIRTVEQITGIRVDHHMVIDFSGFKDMVDAVDGVEVCLKEPIDDTDATARAARGQAEARGEQALGFVRARKSSATAATPSAWTASSSSWARSSRRCRATAYCSTRPRLYPVLDAATKSLTTDPGLTR